MVQNKKASPAAPSPILNYPASTSAEQFHSDLLFLLDLKEAEQEGAKPRIFFDTYGAIDMLTGLVKLGQGGRFQMGLFNAQETLAYALAFKSWLGKIYLLPPHTGELIFKIRSNDGILFGGKAADFEVREREMWGDLGLKSYESLKSNKTNAPEVLKVESTQIFKAFYLLRERGFWESRYKHLMDSGVLDFLQEPGYRMGDLTKLPLFEELNRSLNLRRPHRSDNNYSDAVALCLLDQKHHKIRGRKAQQDCRRVRPSGGRFLQKVHRLA